MWLTTEARQGCRRGDLSTGCFFPRSPQSLRRRKKHPMATPVERGASPRRRAARRLDRRSSTECSGFCDGAGRSSAPSRGSSTRDGSSLATNAKPRTSSASFTWPASSFGFDVAREVASFIAAMRIGTTRVGGGAAGAPRVLRRLCGARRGGAAATGPLDGNRESAFSYYAMRSSRRGGPAAVTS